MHHNGAAFEIQNLVFVVVVVCGVFVWLCFGFLFFFFSFEIPAVLNNDLPLENVWKVLGICTVGIGARRGARDCVVERLH